jgi:hypothetical protein
MTARTLDPSALVLDRQAYAAVRPGLRSQLIPLRASRRVRVGDIVALEFENATTLQYQVQEMLIVESVTDPAEIAHEIEAYERLLPTSHSLVATFFVECDDINTAKDELLRLTDIQHSVALFIADLPPVPGFEVVGLDEDGPSELTQAVHFLRFTLDDAARDAFRDPQVPARVVIEHPEYRASGPIAGATRLELISDLAL